MSQKNIVMKISLIAAVIVVVVLVFGDITPVFAQKTVELENPVKSIDSVEGAMGLFAKAILYILGSVALLVLVYSGVKLVLSRGNADTVKMSSNALLWATIGLLVAFGSYVILKQALTFMTGFSGG